MVRKPRILLCWIRTADLAMTGEKFASEAAPTGGLTVRTDRLTREPKFKHRTAGALWLLFLTLFPVLAATSDFQTPAITPQALTERQAGAKPLVIIDVRKSGEYKSGHVPGALNIPHDKLARKLDKLEGASGVVVYCINGRRTKLAEQTLIENDIDNVFHLEGGLMGWRQAGYKVKAGWGP